MAPYQRGISLVVAVGLLAVVATIGCAGGGRATEGERAVGSMADTKEQIDRAKALVNKTTASLDQLAAGGDLQKSYGDFKRATRELELAGDEARSRWQDMRERGNEYKQKWHAEAAENPEFKQTLEARRERLRENYDKISATTRQAKEACDAFVADLYEIQRALAFELTPAAVSSLQPAFANTKIKAATLNQRLDALAAELTEVMGDTTPSTPTTPAK